MEPVWRVLIFLAPLCPICQNMSFDLRQLEKDFAGEPVEFVGVFPNASTTEAQIATFQQTYGLDMTMGKDTAHWAEALGARWTPEVFVLDEADSVVYQGRINDRYFAPGKRKPKTKRRDLDAALRDCLAGRAVARTRHGRRGMPHRRGTPDSPSGLTAFFFCKVHQHQIANGTPKKAETTHEDHEAERSLQTPKPPCFSGHALG